MLTISAIPTRLAAVRARTRHYVRLAFVAAADRARPTLAKVLRSLNLDGLIPALILAYGCTVLIDPRAFWFVLGAVMTGDYLLSELRTLRPPRS